MNYPLDVGGVGDYPVKVGSMLLTLVEPSPGFERAYNRWYERDHYYAGCLVGPWLFAGSRWVAPRRLKDRRWPAESVIARSGRRRQLRRHLLGGAGPSRRPLRGVGRAPGHGSSTPGDGGFRNGPTYTPRSSTTSTRSTATTTRSRWSWPSTTTTTVCSSCGGTPDRVRRTSSIGSWRPIISAGSSTARTSRSPRPGCRRYPTRVRGTSPWTWDHRRAAPTAWCSSCSSGATPRPRSTGSGPTPRGCRSAGLADLLLAAPFFRTVVGTDTYVDEL